MKNTKKVAPKPVSIKNSTLQKPVVELVSYSIKMVIPTGQYANIQPEIIVKSGSIEDAHNFIAPHMNKLWKEYFMVNERRPEVSKSIAPQTVPYYPNTPVAPIPTVTTVSQPVTPKEKITTVGTENIKNALGGTIIGEGLPAKPVDAVQPPDSSVALVKATNAINACLSLDALELIQNQVIKSVKLSHEDKESLMPLLHDKAVELTFPENEKRGQ